MRALATLELSAASGTESMVNSDQTSLDL